MNDEEKNSDFFISIITLGEASVGKTSIINRYINNIFDDYTISTIGCDFKMHFITIDDKKIRMKIWDTAGQERFNSIQNQYYKNVDGVLLVFDKTSLSTFENLNKWFEKIEKHSPKNCIVALAGNKKDLTNNIEVEDDYAENFALENFGIKYYSVSAQNGENIKEIFEYLVREILKNKEEKDNRETIVVKNNFRVSKAIGKKKKKKNCC